MDIPIDIFVVRSQGYGPTFYQHNPSYDVYNFGADFGASTSDITLALFNANIVIMQGTTRRTPTAIAADGTGRWYLTCYISQYGGEPIMTHTSGVLTFADSSPIPSFVVRIEPLIRYGGM